MSALVTFGWLLALQHAGAYDLRKVSTGIQEVRRVIQSAATLAGSVAIVAYLTQILIARTFVAIVIPVGALLQIFFRFVVRRGVYARRARGEWTSAILAVGTSESVRHLVDATRRNPLAGLRVVGACVEDAGKNPELVAGVPVLGHFEKRRRPPSG